MPNDKAFNFQEGMNEYSDKTFDCGSEYGGCIYQYKGRCCFHVATIQQNISKACYDPYSGSDYD